MYRFCIKYFFLAFFILSAGCKNQSKTDIKSDKEPLTINIADNLKVSENLKLSSIVSDIDYIKLETTPESFFGPSFDVYVLGEFIFIKDNFDNKLLIFDKIGKYLRKISKIGKGPDEYTSIINFIPIPEKNLIIINSREKLIHYDLEGNMIFSRPMEEYMFSTVYLNSEEIVSHNLPTKENYSIYYRDHKAFVTDKAISDIHYEEREINGYMSYGKSFYRYKDDIMFYFAIDKKVYRISDKNNIEPHIYFEMGTYASPADLFYYAVENAKGKIYVRSIHESDNFVFFDYNKIPEPNEMIYNKDNDQYYHKLENDIFFDEEFYIEKIVDNSIIRTLNPFTLKENLKEGKYENLAFPNDKQNKEFIELINSLNENDNPVIQIIKLKK